MRRALLFVAPVLLAGTLLSTCDLFSVPSTDFESDSTVGTLQITIPWIAPWVTAALDGSRAYLRVSAVSVTLYNSQNDLVQSSTLTVGPAQVEDNQPLTTNWTVPNGTGYRLEVAIYNENAPAYPAAVLQGTATNITVAGGSTPVTVTCKPVSPTPLTEDTPVLTSLKAAGEQWFVAQAAGTNTRFYCDTTEGGTADIWVFDGNGIFKKYAAGQINDVVHLDTADTEIYYVGIYASTATTATSVMFASTTMDLTIEVTSATFNAGRLTVGYKVTNTGVDTTGSFQVTVADGSYGSGSASHSNVAPGQANAVTGSIEFVTSRTDGTVTATVDSSSQVDESDESNNTATLGWTGGTGTIVITIQ